MLKQGNSKADTCLTNLLSLTQGEVQIDQCRGLRADLTDMPASTAYAFLQAAAYWVAANYEPRADFSGATFSLADQAQANFNLTSTIPQ